MVFRLYEVGIVYYGDFSESDYIVFKNDADAERFIKTAAIKLMITFVPQTRFNKLKEISDKYFGGKKPEEITSHDIDKITEITTLNKLYNELSKIQDKNQGVKEYFYEKVQYFTDEHDNKYEFILKPIK